MINATAANLSAFDTVAKDPSGLDSAGQQTSTYQCTPLSPTTTSALESAGQPMLSAWIGVAGEMSTLAMAGTGALRIISRKRRCADFLPW